MEDDKNKKSDIEELLLNTEKIYWFRFIPKKFPAILLFLVAASFLCLSIFCLSELSESGIFGIIVLFIALCSFIFFLVCFALSRAVRRDSIGDILKEGVPVWKKNFIFFNICFSIFALFALYYVISRIIIHY